LYPIRISYQKVPADVAIEFPTEFSNIIDFIFYPNVITFSSGSKVCQTAYTFLLRNIIEKYMYELGQTGSPNL